VNLENAQKDLPDYLKDLNPPQLEAVCHFEGPILVLAGAGSGKTRVLTRRVAHLVLAHGVQPQNILAVTFTNKATDEMRERLHGLLGERANQLWVATFHSAALRMLRRHADLLSYRPDFVVYDDQDARKVLKEVLKECKVDLKKDPLESFEQVIDRAKNDFITAEQFADYAAGKRPAWLKDIACKEQLQADVYDRYQKALLKANAMDFGDLLLNSVLVLQKFPEVLKYYQRQLRFILVDEFQDTNKVQYLFIQLLTQTHHNILAVGDDDQSIYAFRGAAIGNILEFERDFPQARIVMLEQNYRSSGNILAAAYGVIRRNQGRRRKKLWTASDAGVPLRAFAGMDETEEAEFVAQQILELQSSGRAFKDIAVFYRVNAQSRVLEEVFVNHGIPYRIFGGQKFYERKEIRDILAYLRLVVNEADDQAFLRVINTPPRGIGAQTLQAIAELAGKRGIPLLAAARKLSAHNKNLQTFLDLMQELSKATESQYLGRLIGTVVELSGYGPRLKASQDVTSQSRLENLNELEAIGRSMELSGATQRETLQHFLDRVSLSTSDELPSNKSAGLREPAQKQDAVSLMTLHLAKGLEFPVVFLTGLEEGLLPHYRSILDDNQVEEERRLCYVGITRAMQELFLTCAHTRGLFASSNGLSFSSSYREASRFWYDIPEEIIEYRSLSVLS